MSLIIASVSIVTVCLSLTTSFAFRMQLYLFCVFSLSISFHLSPFDTLLDAKSFSRSCAHSGKDSSGLYLLKWYEHIQASFSNLLQKENCVTHHLSNLYICYKRNLLALSWLGLWLVGHVKSRMFITGSSSSTSAHHLPSLLNTGFREGASCGTVTSLWVPLPLGAPKHSSSWLKTLSEVLSQETKCFQRFSKQHERRNCCNNLEFVLPTEESWLSFDFKAYSSYTTNSGQVISS